MNWTETISNLGVAVAIIVAIGYFINIKIWPYITKKWDEMQTRMDMKDARMLELQEKHHQDTQRVIENYERHTTAQLGALARNEAKMKDMDDAMHRHHNAVMTELQFLKESKEKKPDSTK